MIEETYLGEIAAMFKVLGEVSRLRILQQLMENTSLSVGTISQRTGLSTPNTSKHLRTLQHAGLVSNSRQGNTILYALDHPMVREICEICCRHMESDDRQRLAKLIRKTNSPPVEKP